MRGFFLHLINERGYAPKSIRQARAGLVSFFRDMLGFAEWKVFDHVRTKDREQLPVVLSRDEVRRILTQVKERRFAVPLRLIYLCGLRLSEALHIEVRDIHRKEQRLHIREGKGGKDRYVPLPQAALEDLSQWYRWHRHPRYLLIQSPPHGSFTPPLRCGAAPSSQSVSAPASRLGSPRWVTHGAQRNAKTPPKRRKCSACNCTGRSIP